MKDKVEQFYGNVQTILLETNLERIKPQVSVSSWDFF